MKKNRTRFCGVVLMIFAPITTLCFSSLKEAVAQPVNEAEDEMMMGDMGMEMGGMGMGMGMDGMMGGMGLVEQGPSPLERQIAFLKKARTDEQKETVKQRIRKELVRQYDTYLVASSDELKRLELRLVKLREKLVVRENAKEKMIDLELQRIVNEAEGLAWPKKMNQRRPNSGFGGMEGLGPVDRQPVKPRTTPRQELQGELPPAKAETKPKSPPKTLSRKEKEKTKNWLRQIGIGCLNYESPHEHFPRNFEDEIGTPLLSWRVAILPFVGEKDLYEKFHLDEAWDSTHNKKLLNEMPSIYGTNSADGKTSRLGIADRGGVFEPGVKVKFSSIIDGSSNTILCVNLKDEGQSRFWTEPSDLTIDQFIDVAGGGSLIVCICDGSVVELPDNISSADLRRLATRNDNEVVKAHVQNK